MIMSIKETLRYAGICAGIAALAFCGTEAWAFQDEEDITVTVVNNTPTLNISTPMNIGTQYMAVSKAGTTASAILTAAGVLTHTPGAAGAARLIPIDTSSKAAMVFEVTAGIPSAVMSLKISDDSDNATVTLVGETTPADATFTLNTWTATASVGTLSTALNPSTGLGGITLDNTGAATLAFGATLKTDNSGNAYSDQDYTGTIRVAVAY